ncbi:MAG: Ig-like domain-containing protein [Pirellulaceae bacterium]|nr:Ig-like domain-containing protein [Pirellulaceae bacterium]
MSGLQNRHSLTAFFSSKSLSKRWRTRIASIARSSKRRSLLVESLERRELMASDLGAIQHNSLIATDVNGDFQISPIDALQVINALNRQSRGTLNASDTDTIAQMVDVSNDGLLSPIDALMVINKLKSGEGVGELAQIEVQILNSAGTPIQPNVVAGVNEYTVAPGEKFTLRTRTRDLRSNATGVFSTFVDINYATQGSATTELAQVLWSEAQSISLPFGANGGSFTLTYGSETTAPINFSNNLATMRTSIRNAIGALNFVGGVSNISVNSIAASSNQGPLFDVFFTGNLARQNVQNPVIGTNNLTVSGAGANTITLTTVADPTDKLSLFAAFSYPVNQISGSSQLVYDASPPVATFQTVGNTGLKIDNAGSFSSAISASFDDPSAYVSIFDTAYRAATMSGIVDFTVGSSQNTLQGIGLYDNDTNLADSVVTYPAPFRVVIASDLQAIADSFTVVENSGATTLDVLANDSKLAGTTINITGITQPATGGTVVNNGSSVSFTPTAGFNGVATFTYTVTNNQPTPKMSTATVTATVSAANKAPVALGTPLSATEDGPAVTFTPSQLFLPGAGEDTQTVTLSNVSLVPGQTGGTFSLVSGNVSFTPSVADFNGPILFRVTGTDNGTPAASTTATFTVTVTPVNDPPIANGTMFTTLEDTPFTILASDIFNPGPANESTQAVVLVSAVPVAGQTGGTIVVDTGNARFTPDANFSGTFVFVAIANDGETEPLQSQPSTVTITVTPVNDPPTANADSLSAPGITSITTTLDVLANDSSGDVGGTIRVTAISVLSGAGTIAIGPNGQSILYTPGATSIGNTETFSYTITDDGGLMATATVQVQVVPPRLPFAVNDSISVAEDSNQTIINVLTNDLFNNGATKRLVSIGALTPSNAGTIVNLDNGTPSDTTDDTIGFTPASNFAGIASFTYVMTDSADGSPNETGTVFITVTEINDAPTVVNQTVSGTEDTPLTILASTALAGSSAGPNESNQTFTITAVSVVTPSQGTVVVTNGNIVFTPAADFNGPALLRYTATDNGTNNGVAAPLTASATITVNVAAVNDAPIAGNDAGTTAEGSTLTLTGTSVLSNDRPGPATALDEVSQTLSIVSVVMANGAAGSVALSNGNIVFTPPAFFNGTSSAIYTIQDNGTGNPQATGTIVFTVTPVNDPPVPVAASRNANATIPINIDLTAELALASRGGGADEATQTVRVNRVIPLTGANATQGTVTLNTDGTIRYLAPAGFSGPDSFDYEIIDNGTTNGQADPKTGIARITVNVAAFQPSTIRGQVWIDDNKDGSVNNNELFLDGIEVVLTGRAVGATSDITPIAVASLRDGSYEFSNLGPGSYTVSFTPPVKMLDAPAPNSVSTTIAAPGGTTTAHNFSVYGFEAGYENILENIENAYYLRNGQQWRQLGLTALVRPDGTSAWTIHRGGFESYVHNEVRVLSNGQVQIFSVLPNLQVVTATVPRGRYLANTDASGNAVVRILMTAAELTFTSTGSAEGEGAAPSVDRFFSDYGR